MIAICNRLSVKEGAVGQVVERLRTAGERAVVTMLRLVWRCCAPREALNRRMRSWPSGAGEAGVPSMPGLGAKSSVHRPP